MMDTAEATGNTTILFLGRNAFSDELLAGFLQKRTGLPCRFMMLDKFSAACMRPTDQTVMIFLDCTGFAQSQLLLFLKSNRIPDGDLSFFALRNVDPDWHIEHQALDIGVRGCLYNNHDAEMYIRAVRAMLRKELWYPREILEEHLLAGPSHPPMYSVAALSSLTVRERKIFSLLISGLSNQEIAQRSCISLHTVKTHLYNIFKKINVENRLQATLWTVHHSLS